MLGLEIFIGFGVAVFCLGADFVFSAVFFYRVDAGVCVLVMVGSQADAFYNFFLRATALPTYPFPYK